MSDVLVAAIAAIGVLGAALISRPSKAIKRIDERTKELEHNGGGSIKDDTYGTARAVGLLQRRLDTFLGVAAIHHPEHAELYLALRSDHDNEDA